MSGESSGGDGELSFSTILFLPSAPHKMLPFTH